MARRSRRLRSLTVAVALTVLAVALFLRVDQGLGALALFCAAATYCWREAGRTA